MKARHRKMSSQEKDVSCGHDEKAKKGVQKVDRSPKVRTVRRLY
jgi:hypothetical protein